MFTKEMLQELIKVANKLDEKGLFEEAQELDNILMSVAGKKKKKEDKKKDKDEDDKDDEKEDDARDAGKARRPAAKSVPGKMPTTKTPKSPELSKKPDPKLPK